MTGSIAAVHAVMQDNVQWICWRVARVRAQGGLPVGGRHSPARLRRARGLQLGSPRGDKEKEDRLLDGRIPHDRRGPVCLVPARRQL